MKIAEIDTPDKFDIRQLVAKLLKHVIIHAAAVQNDPAQSGHIGDQCAQLIKAVVADLDILKNKFLISQRDRLTVELQLIIDPDPRISLRELCGVPDLKIVLLLRQVNGRQVREP